MGLLDFFRRKALSASPAVVEALQDRRLNPYPALGGTNQRIWNAYKRGIDGSYGWIYSTQPAVRSTIDFIARNVAQLGLKLYERVEDDERQRREDHAAAELMRDPDGVQPPDAFIYRLVTDFCIWDNAYVLKVRPQNGNGRMFLVRVPPNMVEVAGGRFTATAYMVWRYDGSSFPVAPEDLIHWYGYNPEDPLMGLSKLETLREELATDRATQSALVELAKSGLRGGYIKRPLDAPPWDDADAQRFAEQWRQQKNRADGSDPVLEEGMEFEMASGMSVKDAEIIAARQFTKSEVASLYGVPLQAMGGGQVGTPDTAESRKLIYGDVLPPITRLLGHVLDKGLLQAEFAEDDYYFEFDLDEKLRGDVEGRSAAQTATVGRPWRTVNEVRATENLPPIDGGDDLTIPLNVMLTGPNSPALPAPNVMPPQNPIGPPADGSENEEQAAARQMHKGGVVPGPQEIRLLPWHFGKQLEVTTQPKRVADFNRQQRYVDEARAMFDRYYRRLKSRAKAAVPERADAELTADLDRYLHGLVDREGALYANRLGAADFDMRLVHHYLQAMAEGSAEAINRVTRADIAEHGTESALAVAQKNRALTAAATIGTRATVFARQEAAKQAPGTEHRVQTWIADTERHSALDGVSVALGSDWGGIEPGTEPGCKCSMLIT